jgi:hypothetical protein
MATLIRERDLQTFNDAMLAKQAWRLFDRPIVYVHVFYRGDTIPMVTFFQRVAWQVYHQHGGQFRKGEKFSSKG